MTKAKQELLALKDSLGLQNDRVLDTDLMPLINIVWNKSFARVEKNQNAISDCDWNPLNKHLLVDPTLRSTMTTEERSNQYHQLNEIILPSNRLQCDGDTVTETETEPTLNNLPTHEHLNFSTGLNQYCLKAYLSNEKMQQAREEKREDMNNGKSIKQQLKESTRLLAGILFKAGSSQLRKMAFDVYRENMIEKNEKEIQRIKKDELMYKE